MKSRACAWVDDDFYQTRTKGGEPEMWERLLKKEAKEFERTERGFRFPLVEKAKRRERIAAKNVPKDFPPPPVFKAKLDKNSKERMNRKLSK